MPASKKSLAFQPLSRSPGTSLHRQIYMVLLNEIKNGAYAETGALPKEESLCERFKVSRITVRRTLADLASQGYVERRHGLGTFVRVGMDTVAPTPSLGLLEDLRRAAADSLVEVLEVGLRVPPMAVARALRLELPAKAMHAVRVRKSGDTPTMLTEAWIPPTLGKGVTATALKKRPLYEVLQVQGVEFGRVIQELTAVPADPAKAQVLRIGVGMPLLKLVRLMHDLDERPILHISIYLSPDHSRILMDIPANAVNTMTTGQIIHPR